MAPPVRLDGGGINKNRAVRLAGRFYLLAALSSIIATNAFHPSPGASPAERLHTLLDGDTATIGLQMAVIAILLMISLPASSARPAPGGRLN